jgi:hypothetical protein
MASSIIPAGSDRQFGTELSANVPSARLTTSTPRPLKRPVPSFYKDRHADDDRPGKKLELWMTSTFTFETTAMSPLHRENGWNIVDLGGL